LCSKMKFLVLFLFSFCLSAEARKFKTAADVREHLENVEYEELTRAAEATAKDALVLAKELGLVMKAENRLQFLWPGCINCLVTVIPNVMDSIAGGFLEKFNGGCIIKSCLCELFDLQTNKIYRQVLKIIGFC